MTWQSQVDQWFRANPNATAAEIQSAAASVGGSFDPTTGRVSYQGPAYQSPTYRAPAAAQQTGGLTDLDRLHRPDIAKA
jgi:hypothetical protein